MSKREGRRFAGVAEGAAAEEADSAAADAARSKRDEDRTGFISPHIKHVMILVTDLDHAYLALESVSTFSGREGRTGKRGKRARSWREKDMVNQSNVQPNNLLNYRFLYYRSVPDERAIRDTFGDAGGDASASPRW